MLSAGLGSELPLTRPRSRSIACHLKHPPIAAKLLLALAFWNVRDVDLSDVQPDVPPVPASSFDRVEPLQRGGSAAAEVRAAAQRGAYMRLASVPAAAAESSRSGTVPVGAPILWNEPGTCHGLGERARDDGTALRDKDRMGMCLFARIAFIYSDCPPSPARILQFTTSAFWSACCV